MYYDPVKCGERIRELRRKNKYTQSQMAARLNISPDHMKSIEAGRRGCSIDLFIELAVLLNVSLDYLIVGRPLNLDKARDEIQESIWRLEKAKKMLRSWKGVSEYTEIGQTCTTCHSEKMRFPATI